MKILIADDSPAHLKLLRVTLRTLGHETVEAADGVEALNLLATQPFDALITDILMPNMDGYRLCSEIRNTLVLGAFPIIVYSSTYQSPGDHDLALRFGASCFLEKPAPPEVLDATLRKALQRPIPSTALRSSDEVGTLKQYSDRLVIKIEEKNIELQKRTVELEASEEKFRQLAENIQEVFWMTDVRTSAMVYVSPAFENIWGRTCEEVYRNPQAWMDSIHDDDRERIRTQVAAQVPVKEPYTLDYRIVRPDKTIRWIHVRAFPVRNSSGEIYRIAGIAADVTERKNLERQYLQAQKMEAVGRLAGGVAHDFNNLLTAIIGYSQLALGRLDPRDPLHKDITEIVKSGDRAAALTRQLLSFSRKQILQLITLNVNTIVTDVERLLRRLIGEDITLITSLGDNLPNVSVDSGQIEQVIVNLAVNARDAMPKGGKLILETTVAEIDADYARAHPGILEGSYVLLAITDSGMGMTEDVKAHLFEPFFTTKEVGKGTGLGLATVHGIIRQSGGHIHVYTEPGKGTTFKIYLPPSDRKADVAPKSADRGDNRGGTETLLLAEDDASVRGLAGTLLRRAGYTVLEAQNGNEAIEVSRRHGAPIHLLLSDVVMPGFGGFALGRLLREARPGLRVMLMSGYTDTALTADGLLSEEITFIGKPFTPDNLLRKVREALDRKSGPAIP